MYNKKDLDVVIFFLTRMKDEWSEVGDLQVHPAGSKYLLGQFLRQLILPKENIIYSYKADALWKKLKSESNDPMIDYVWQKRVVSEFDSPLEVKTYKGASKHPVVRTLQKGDSFAYREVFHDEHVIPLKVIIDELVKLEEPNHENVQNVISKITICKMLKYEDREIKVKYKRPFSTKKVIEELYLDSWIFIVDYQYPQWAHHDELAYDDSLSYVIPKEAVIRQFKHPEEYGETIVELPNGMTTDAYSDEKHLYTITNDDKLIRYILKIQEVFAN